MPAVSAQTDTITNPVSSLLTDTVLPQSIDLKQDISHLSFQELRLLRSYPYAIHGYHFMEADINAFFSANTKWYNYANINSYNGIPITWEIQITSSTCSNLRI